MTLERRYAEMQNARTSHRLDANALLARRPPINKRLFQAIINARCTDALLWSFTSLIGIVVACLHSIPLLTNSWVYLTEPRPFNKTNENGEFLETVFHYRAGYFQMCREHISNVYDTDDIALYLSRKESELQCQWNPIFTGEDLTEFSSATLAIENRLAVPALMHVIGATMCYVAFCLGALGHIKRNSRTLLSAILYICGGLVVLMGVLQFVCVVDDELAPRMKPNAAGEPSKFTFQYGYSFFFSSLSFLPLQMCACFHAFLYFRRYPTAIDKMKVVPGLEAKMRRAEVDNTMYITPAEPVKRGSLCGVYPPAHSTSSKLQKSSVSPSHMQIPPPPPPRLSSIKKSPSIIFVIENV
ncbi:Voltage-dependent calcium channel gamma-5 subunit [Toxocara canis]|uniref:Voltage-dependent calcium channel gamma-5 subunit n=1 Tax=Toxocara canis TaxID=6265 RepID=A0A0B2VYS7_TOXCA|nr:Voltage-dependent calcium channel gamma-5 subunit [Toxocara canis]